MPLTKQRSPEEWAKLIQEVRERAAEKKRRRRASLMKQRVKQERQRHRDARRVLLQKLKWANAMVRDRRYTAC